jgi:hypothetical protein
MSEHRKNKVMSRIRQILKKKRSAPSGWDIEDIDSDLHRIIFETSDESILFSVGCNDHASCIEWTFAALVLFPKKK